MNDIELYGWIRVHINEDSALGPVLLGDDILANWTLFSIANDLIELIGLMCGEPIKNKIQEILPSISEVSIHINDRRQRHADIWLTINDEVYVNRNIFISPEVKEMIEVAV